MERDVINYNGLYRITDDGVLYRIWKKGKKVVKSHRNGKTEHQFAHLCKDGIPHKEYIHRLVAFAFPEICGEWFEGAEVNHKDENPRNNKATNLEWVSHRYNNAYGTKGEKQGKKTSKGIVEQLEKGVVINEFNSAEQAGKITGINANHIRSCCKGEYGYKSAGGYEWRFKNKRE